MVKQMFPTLLTKCFLSYEVLPVFVRQSAHHVTMLGHHSLSSLDCDRNNGICLTGARFDLRLLLIHEILI
jgi:hypothetical protein